MFKGLQEKLTVNVLFLIKLFYLNKRKITLTSNLLKQHIKLEMCPQDIDAPTFPPLSQNFQEGQTEANQNASPKLEASPKLGNRGQKKKINENKYQLKILGFQVTLKHDRQKPKQNLKQQTLQLDYLTNNIKRLLLHKSFDVEIVGTITIEKKIHEIFILVNNSFLNFT